MRKNMEASEATTSKNSNAGLSIVKSDASKMLEAALQQMDGIISGTFPTHYINCTTFYLTQIPLITL